MSSFVNAAGSSGIDWDLLTSGEKYLLMMYMFNQTTVAASDTAGWSQGYGQGGFTLTVGLRGMGSPHDVLNSSTDFDGTIAAIPLNWSNIRYLRFNVSLKYKERNASSAAHASVYWYAYALSSIYAKDSTKYVPTAINSNYYGRSTMHSATLTPSMYNTWDSYSQNHEFYLPSYFKTYGSYTTWGIIVFYIDIGDKVYNQISETSVTLTNFTTQDGKVHSPANWNY